MMKTTVKSPNKREEKKQVNIAWSPRLGFQLGIIASCLIIFFIMQTPFKARIFSSPEFSNYGLEEPPVINYEIEVDQPQPIAAINREPVKPTSIVNRTKTDVFKVVDNLSNVVESQIPSAEEPILQVPKVEVPQKVIPEPTGPTSIINVEFVPVYPGCESLKSNAEKIDCLSSQINIFINKNFRKEILENLESNQIHKIYVQFKIDSNGFIADVRANSNNEKLKMEAQRVVANLPRMKPGRQGDRNVDVIYTVPIVFRIQ